jgi:hypothetical protein
MSLHVRILWDLLDPKDVTGDPPAEVLRQFSLHCLSEEQLYSFRNPTSCELISPTLIKLGTSASVTKHGKLATQVRLIEDDEMDSDYTMSEDDDVIGDYQSALVTHLSSEAV